MEQTPIPEEVVNEVIDAFGIHPAGKATIRELVKIVNDIEGPLPAKSLSVWRWVFRP